MALKVGVGVPVAVTVKLLDRPAVKVVPLALVICGAMPTVSRATALVAFPATLVAMHWNWSPLIGAVADVTVNVAVAVPE